MEPADPGDDLVTTIDLDVQFAAERACSDILTDAEAQRCTVVVLDPDDGAVVALATLPDFDPNDREGVATRSCSETSPSGAPSSLDRR